MLTAYQTVVQSAAIHPDWDAESHAMYLRMEYMGPSDYFIAQISPEGLVRTCQKWLDSKNLRQDVATALDFA